MAAPIKGTWNRQNVVNYATTQKWGTGINPVHAQYGSPAARVTGRDTADYHAPGDAVPDSLTNRELWGYTPEDTLWSGVQYDGRPPLGTSTSRGTAGDQPPVNATGAVKSRFRNMFGGARRIDAKLADSLPSETVSEGWINKPQDGQVAYSEPSADSQLIVQTSDIQRFEIRINDASVARATDVPRTPISSRVAPMKVKHYSEGERHYDMMPREQYDIPRAFYFRTAGTGDADAMAPNEMYVSEPIQRVTPPDPDLGVMEDDVSLGYGYTAEDSVYG